ncbi:uncharacterized protein METZ01_LOCUS123352, partial [marine metagenome]
VARAVQHIEAAVTDGDVITLIEETT